MDRVSRYASSMREEIILHGGNNSGTGAIAVKAGQLSMLIRDGSVRYIRTGTHEIIRMIYFALRDSDWLTIDGRPELIKKDIVEEEFTFIYRADYKRSEIDFETIFTIRGEKNNSITFSFEGRALSDFMRNRIGLCLLHPSSLTAGKTCILTHCNGLNEKSVFPSAISPHQPFTDLRRIQWDTEGCKIIAEFTGDIFETEDQRNWTDSSFKTYCTPLSLPFPQLIRKGTVIKQSISVKVECQQLNMDNNVNRHKICLHPEEKIRLPLTGVTRSSHGIPLPGNEIDILSKVGFDHYRVELKMFGKSWISEAQDAVLEARKLGLRSVFALIFDDNFMQQINEFLKWQEGEKHKIDLIFILHRNMAVTPAEMASKLIPLIRSANPQVRIGSGTNANFAQLNRERPADGSDIAFYSAHPQEHASDNLTLAENTEALADTVLTAREFSDGKGIWVSPVTIQRRFNANKTFIEAELKPDEMHAIIDSRLVSLFGACWSLASLKNLTMAGAEGVTFFETTGERGIIQGDSDSRWPQLFPAISGMIFPVYHLFRYILSMGEVFVIRCDVSDPKAVQCMAFRNGSSIKMILVNLTEKVQDIFIDSLPGLRIFALDKSSYPDAVADHEWLNKAHRRDLEPGKVLQITPFSINFLERSAEL